MIYLNNSFPGIYVTYKCFGNKLIGISEQKSKVQVIPTLSYNRE